MIKPATKIRNLLRKKVIGNDYWNVIEHKRPALIKQLKKEHADRYRSELENANVGTNMRAKQVHAVRLADDKNKLKEVSSGGGGGGQ